MKIEISKLRKWDNSKICSQPHAFLLSITNSNSLRFELDPAVSLNDIEDLETNLTDIIKQLQDYRLGQNHD